VQKYFLFDTLTRKSKTKTLFSPQIPIFWDCGSGLDAVLLQRFKKVSKLSL
jgi:hypothetical protein